MRARVTQINSAIVSIFQFDSLLEFLFSLYDLMSGADTLLLRTHFKLLKDFRIFERFGIYFFLIILQTKQ